MGRRPDPRARSSSIAGRSGVIAAAAFWHLLQDDLEDAERLAREALESPTAPGASRFIAQSYQVLGSVRYRQRGPADALELVAEGHGALDAADAPSNDHCPLHDLGSQFCLSVGDLDGARREADAYVKIARATGKPSRISIALGTEGEPGSPKTPTVRSPRSTRASPSPVPAEQTPASRSSVPPNCALEPATDSVPSPNCGTPIAICHDRGSRINLGSAVERAVAILASLRDDTLAATCAGIVQAQLSPPTAPFPKSTAPPPESLSGSGRTHTKPPTPVAPHSPSKGPHPRSSPRSRTSSRPLMYPHPPATRESSSGSGRSTISVARSRNRSPTDPRQNYPGQPTDLQRWVGGSWSRSTRPVPRATVHTAS